jgi:hypothetical protein
LNSEIKLKELHQEGSKKSLKKRKTSVASRGDPNSGSKLGKYGKSKRKSNKVFRSPTPSEEGQSPKKSESKQSMDLSNKQLVGSSFNSADANLVVERLVDEDTEEGEDHDYLKAANVIKV